MESSSIKELMLLLKYRGMNFLSHAVFSSFIFSAYPQNVQSEETVFICWQVKAKERGLRSCRVVKDSSNVKDRLSEVAVLQ